MLRPWPSILLLFIVFALGCQPKPPARSGATTPPTSGTISEADVVEEIASGGDHSCARYRSGHVACWGAGQQGELGHGRAEDEAGAVVVANLRDAIGIAAGRSHTCAVQRSGRVQCWGRNREGQVGDGQGGPQATAQRQPVTVRGLQDAIAVASGYDHTCALRRTREIVCWGENRDGQLGTRDRPYSPQPMPIAGLAGIEDIVTGEGHTCVRRTQGSVLCWGRGKEAQLGDGGQASSERPRVVVNSETARSLVAGARHTCMRLADESVWCWGNNANGQVGPSLPQKPVLRPARVAQAAGSSELAAGDDHTCSRSRDGRVSCWGVPTEGRLGIEPAAIVPTLAVIQGLPSAREIASGTAHTCALGAEGQVFCWGRNRGSALGSGEVGPSSNPADAEVSGLQDVASIVAGDDFVCARRNTGTVECWGRNDQGQLGDGSKVGRRKPRPVAGLSGVTSLGAGGDRACATTRQGQVYCWGEGYGSTAKAVPGLRDMAAVTVGRNHQCAWDRRGSAWCWGDNTFLQLGTSAPVRNDQPVRVESLPPVLAVSAGSFHTCAIQSGGQVHCWGRNQFGQIGNGAGARELETPLARPHRVVRVDDATTIALGDEHSCVVRKTGAAACWGRNQVGQLGAGVESDWSTRVPVRDLVNTLALTAGPRLNCASLTSGAVRCWGENKSGALGLESPPVARIPIEVPGLAQTRAVAAGLEHSCALRSNGHVVCWGSDTYGQRGDGSTPYIARPSRVIDLP